MRNSLQSTNTIENDFIEKVLEIYEERYQFIQAATLSEKDFVAVVSVDSYPYAAQDVFDYVTAPTISLVLGQACYVFTAELIRSATVPQVADIDLAKFFRLRDCGELVFTNMSYKFRKKIPMFADFSVGIKLLSIKRMRTFIAASFQFDSPGYFSGKMSLVANLDEE